MANLKYVKPIPVPLKNHPDYSEKWVQKLIAADPSILGLGELELRDVERRQPRAGRLDLLLAEPDSGRRYEVELMLGTVDESHIIRTIEYWDIERKRYPQYDHCAVIVAEDITARFLNVIGLFNSAIPLIAIQMNALQVENNIVLHFTKVLDEILPGDDDEGASEGQDTDRAFWEKKSSRSTLPIVDECFTILKEFRPTLELSYKRQYIGQTENGIVNHVVVFRPRKGHVRVGIRVQNKQEWIEKLVDTTLGSPFDVRTKKLVLPISMNGLKENRDFIRAMFADACGVENSEAARLEE